jgi:hypothetical protein
MLDIESTEELAETECVLVGSGEMGFTYSCTVTVVEDVKGGNPLAEARAGFKARAGFLGLKFTMNDMSYL